MKKKYLLGVFVASVLPLPALAFDFSHSVSVEAFYEDIKRESMLPHRDGVSVGLNIKPSFYVVEEDWQSAGELQLFSASSNTDIEYDNGQSASKSYANLRELWVGHTGFTDYPGESIRVGVERKRIDDGLIFDSSLTGVSWNFDTSLLQSFVGIGEQQNDYRSDNYILPEETDNLRVSYANVRYQYGVNHAVSGYVIRGSGDENPLSTHLTWRGLGLDNGYYLSGARNGLGYAFNFHQVSGVQKEFVNSNLERVDGDATDAGIRWRFPGAWAKVIGIQFAQASSDYRTTELETNRSKFTDTDPVLYRFNDAIRADFRNLQARSVYFSLAKFSQWDANVIYNQLKVDEVSAPYFVNRQRMELTTSDPHLGQGLDLVLSGYLNSHGPSLYALMPFDSVVRLRLSGFHLSDDLVAANASSTEYSAMLSWIVKL